MCLLFVSFHVKQKRQGMMRENTVTLKNGVYSAVGGFLVFNAWHQSFGVHSSKLT